MSLINQMLQDIEARKVAAQPLLLPASAEVHAVTAKRSHYLPAFLVLALGAVGVYLIKDQALAVLPTDTSIANQIVISEAQAALPMAIEKIAKIEPQVTQSLSFQPVLDKALHLVALNNTSDDTPKLTTQLSTVKNQPKVIVAQPTIVAVADMHPTPTQVDVPSTEAPLETKVALIQATPPKQIAETKVVVKKQMNAEQKSAQEYQMAVNYLQQGRVAEAMDLLKKALETNPQFDDARQTLVGLLIENKRNDEAMQYLKASLAQSSQKTHDAQTLARLQLDAGLDSEALATLQKSQAYANNDAGYQGLMAVILQKQGQHTDAIQHYQLALQSNASNPNWLIGMGVSMQAEGRNEEAKQAYQKIQIGELSPQLAAFVSQRLKQIQ